METTSKLHETPLDVLREVSYGVGLAAGDVITDDDVSRYSPLCTLCPLDVVAYEFAATLSQTSYRDRFGWPLSMCPRGRMAAPTP